MSLYLIRFHLASFVEFSYDRSKCTGDCCQLSTMGHMFMSVNLIFMLWPTLSIGSRQSGGATQDITSSMKIPAEDPECDCDHSLARRTSSDSQGQASSSWIGSMDRKLGSVMKDYSMHPAEAVSDGEWMFPGAVFQQQPIPMTPDLIVGYPQGTPMLKGQNSFSSETKSKSQSQPNGARTSTIVPVSKTRGVGGRPKGSGDRVRRLRKNSRPDNNHEGGNRGRGVRRAKGNGQRGRPTGSKDSMPHTRSQKPKGEDENKMRRKGSGPGRLKGSKDFGLRKQTPRIRRQFGPPLIDGAKKADSASSSRTSGSSDCKIVEERSKRVIPISKLIQKPSLMCFLRGQEAERRSD